MNLKNLVTRVQSYTRDDTGSLFNTSDIKDFVNEGIDRFKKIPELSNMPYLSTDEDIPKFLPPEYHYLLSVYSASRCYTQDEQNYLAQSFMEEFLNALTLLELGIKEGIIVITDDEGNIVDKSNVLDCVVDVYFKKGLL